MNFIRLAGLSGGLLAAAAVSAASPGPDAWSLVLVWSPQYCSANLTSKELQCRAPHDLVPDGLMPVYAGTDPKCSDTPLPQDVADRWTSSIPNGPRIRKIWKTQGACSGLSPEEYGVQMDRATRLVAIPEAFREPLDLVETTVPAMKADFAKLNPGLDAKDISLQCSGHWFKQVTICLSANFQFRNCEADESDKCPTDIKVRPLTSLMQDNARH